MKNKIPQEVLGIAETLHKAGHEAYLVGGCVRDLILNKEPKDWDVATNAMPDEILKLFPESFYENEFGTVGVKTDSLDDRLKVVEVTTFRVEGKYSDKRRPDEVRFVKTIEDDLSRRDFTINALALNLADGIAKNIIDPFEGQNDLKKKIIRAVRDPDERFSEDALRLMRAVRLGTELGFEIEKETAAALRRNAAALGSIARERIRDEVAKILLAEEAASGIERLEEAGLLLYIFPELREGIGVGQNKHHIYTVWEHNIRALEYSAKKGYSLEVRLASLLHDVGKPRTKRGEGPDSTFHGHEVVGAKMARKMLEALCFSKEITDWVTDLVRFHLFYYNVGEVTEAGVRRFLRRVGPDLVPDLIKVREADRIGSGVPKAVPYKIRHLLFMIEKVKQDPISPKMLKMNGNDMMALLKIEPGPRVGFILSILLEEVLDDPSRNTKDYLESRAQELHHREDGELNMLAKTAREKKEEFENVEEEEIKKKFYVK